MSTLDPSQDVDGFVTLHVPCQMAYLRIVRQSVLDMCVRVGLSEFKSAQLEMAVDEAASNIIEHSYGDDEEQDNTNKTMGLRVNLIQHKDRIEVELYDHGKGFDFHGHSEVDPDSYVQAERERGLGMYIINRFVDDVQYEHKSPSGNCLRLVKKF